jgi:hypothetical protein
MYPHGIEEAFKLAVRQRGLLVKARIPVFSPIVHSHPVAMLCGLDPFDYNIWLPSEDAVLQCACGLIMVRADGWEDSFGMNHERNRFENERKPVIMMDPDIIPPELVGMY